MGPDDSLKYHNLAPLLLDRGCAAFRAPRLWTFMVQRAMVNPVGWNRSARAYKALYEAVTGAS
ncbi:MAG: hypothetical protein JXB25_09380 [Deltaproteobacteria bacterium]|nr:hypothetical protein [Deltaproteobacteria bacterium]